MKKLLSVLLSILMIVSCASLNIGVSVFAEEDESAITYSNNGYTFEKISHGDKEVMTTDGIVDYVGNGADASVDEGQGDRGQNYSWSCLAYGDWVYVGTCYSSMGSTLTLMGSALGDSFDKDIMNALENALFNGTFFNGQEDGGDSGGILVKINVKTHEVKIIMSKALNGYSTSFRNAVEYKGKLYFCGTVNSLPSIYQIDPEKDDEIKCVHQGITIQQYYQTYMQKICSGIRGLCVYTDKNGNEKLVVTCVGVNGPYIMITDDTENGFTTIATQEDLFNYPAYHYYDSIYGGSIWEMVEFNNSLYVSICTGTPKNMSDEYTMQSFAIVRGDEQSDGSFKWTPVVGDKDDGATYTFGIDPERTRSGAGVLKVYGDYLYIGEYNDEEIALENILFDKDTSTCPGLDFEFINRNLEQSVSLYRMDKDENIELIVGDATEMFPEGGLSGLDSGFGKNENQYIWRMEEFNGKLYIGTFDTSSLLEVVGRFSNGDLLNMSKEEWQSQINYNKVLFTLIAQKYLAQEEVNAAELGGAIEENEEVIYEQPQTKEEAYALIDQVLDDLNNNGAPAAEALAGENNSLENAICLTDEQKAQLVAGLLDCSIKVNSLDEDICSAVSTLLLELENLGNYLDKKDYDYFKTEYETICNQFKLIVDKIDEKCTVAKDALSKIINEDTLTKLKGLVTCLEYMSEAERGFDLYVTEDGVHFDTVTTDGFNDPYNHGLRVFAAGEDYLAIGTANPFYGTQIWCSNLIPTASDFIFDSTTGEVKAVENKDIGTITTYYKVNGVWTTTKPTTAGTYVVGIVTAKSDSYDALGTVLNPYTNNNTWKYIIVSIEGNDKKSVSEQTKEIAKEVVKKAENQIVTFETFNGKEGSQAGSTSINEVLGNDGYIDVNLISVAYDTKATNVTSSSNIVSYTFEVTAIKNGTEEHNLPSNVTFRLPVVVTGYKYANIYHEGSFIGQVEVKNNSYVEVSSKSFSEYSYTLTNTKYVTPSNNNNGGSGYSAPKTGIE